MLARQAFSTAMASRSALSSPSYFRLHPLVPSLRSGPSLHRHVWRSYATKQVAKKGRKTTVDLSQLTNNEPLTPLPKVEEPVLGYPTVIQQARSNMHKFSDCVVLTRVGSFYELYFEQASEIGSLLNMKVAFKKTALGPVPMAGFPHTQLDRYLRILVNEHGKHVAISEQRDLDADERIKSGGLAFDRQVLRVITPGTLIDETFLTPNEHNYLLAIHAHGDILDPEKAVADEAEAEAEAAVGLAWLDLSSGDFFTQLAPARTLRSAIARIGPREIILPTAIDDIPFSLRAAIATEQSVISQLKSYDAQRLLQDFESQFESSDVSSSFGQLSADEAASGSLLLQYIGEKLPGLQLRLQKPIRQSPDAFMSIDENSMRGLEIKWTMKDRNFKGSLLHSVRRTCTESGARLLADRLSAPSMSLQVINQRLDLVETFLENEPLLHKVTELLKRTSDTLRIVQKFSLGRGDADDLLALADTIHLTRELSGVLSDSEHSTKHCLGDILARFDFDGPLKLANRITKSIDQEGLHMNQRKNALEEAHAAGLARDVLEEEEEDHADVPDLKALSKRVKKVADANTTPPNALDLDIWIMRQNASTTLTRLHKSLTSLREQKEQLETDLRIYYKATSLTLRFTPGLGHNVHFKGKDMRISLDEPDSKTRTLKSSKSTRAIHHPEWTVLGKEIDDARLRIRTEESSILASLRESVIANLVALRRNAAILDEADVSCSFARLAAEHRLTRPRLNSSTRHQIVGGRHLMVEDGLQAGAAGFTPNDCFLGGKDQPHIWLVTGPNMAGKSTFLRQSALLSVLAQTGSFVPAASAEMGLVDAVYSRVGSADNLSGEQSTFMVEMLETAAILRGATARSFVIMDEVGRGTTPEDGIAVGFAVLKHLVEVNGCRGLFATHFHVLGDMVREFGGRVECMCTGVVEDEDGGWAYDHRVRKGVNRESHALKVARMAGMPEGVLKIAEGVLKRVGRDV